jgi:hypothetical protein
MAKKIEGEGNQHLVPANQLALQLFQEFPTLVQTDQDIGYNKPKTLIHVSSLSLLSRRAINACFFLISDSQEQDIHTASLPYFKWLIGFDSKNSSYLKKALTEAQKSLVQVSVVDSRNSDKEAWMSVPLLGKVAMANGQIAFSVDSSVRKLIKNPDQFSYLSLRILAAFTSQYALELYEKLLGYHPEGVTPWISIDDFDKHWVTLKGDQREFKYINRDIIAPAISQINELSNLRVELDTRKAPGSRKITEFRFKIADNPTGKLVIGADDRAKLKELYQTLTEEFGLSESQLESISEMSTEKIVAAIEYTRSRSAAGVRIGIPAKYLLSALQGGWTVPKSRSKQLFQITDSPQAKTETERKAQEKKRAALEETVAAKFKASDSIVSEFLTAAKGEGSHQHAVDAWADFLMSPAAKFIGKKKAIGENFVVALEDSRVRGAFAGYLDSKRK